MFVAKRMLIAKHTMIVFSAGRNHYMELYTNLLGHTNSNWKIGYTNLYVLTEV